MANAIWYKALSYLPSRFHTADSPAAVLARLRQPDPVTAPPEAAVEATPTAPVPAPVITAQLTVPRTLGEVYAALAVPVTAPAAAAPTRPEAPAPLPGELVSEPVFETVPDEVLARQYEEAADAAWEAPHWDAAPTEVHAPDAYERLAQQHGHCEAARGDGDSDAFHLPDFHPGDVDDTAAFLAALRGRGQQAIRLGLQAAQAPN